MRESDVSRMMLVSVALANGTAAVAVWSFVATASATSRSPAALDAMFVSCFHFAQGALYAIGGMVFLYMFSIGVDVVRKFFNILGFSGKGTVQYFRRGLILAIFFFPFMEFSLGIMSTTKTVYVHVLPGIQTDSNCNYTGCTPLSEPDH